MKFAAPLLVVLVFVLAGCGSSSAAKSPLCQSVSAVKTDVQNLKDLKSNPSLSAIQAGLKQLDTDLQKAISQAKSSAGPQVNALKTSAKSLKSTLTEVKNKQLTIPQAIPTLKTQAQTVSADWKSLTSVLKC